MSDAGSQGEGNTLTRSAGEQEIDKIIFKRDLDEVHLLVDFVSGRADKGFSDLRVDVNDPGKPPLVGYQIVHELTGIRYPPPLEPKTKSQQAAFLLAAKDALNSLADPARGMTVAYTAMFVGFAQTGANLSSVALAEEAYPHLKRHAKVFRRFYSGALVFSFIWLVLTAFTYWDIASGRDLMLRADRIAQGRSELVKAAPTILIPETCALPKQENLAACDQKKQLDNDEITLKKDIGSLRNSEGMPILSYAHTLHWGFLVSGIPSTTNNLDIASVRSVLAVFGTYILPMMFGLVGTMIGALRAIQGKVRDSLLAPRDLVLSLIGLPMGAVAGVAVGLFFSPTDGSQTIALGAAHVTLTVSGVGFLAGYGSESFFRMLDGVMDRVFSSAAAVATPNRLVPASAANASSSQTTGNGAQPNAPKAQEPGEGPNNKPSAAG